MNGMPANMWDEEMIRFWPLEEVCSVAVEYAQRPSDTGGVLRSLPDAEHYFIIADYLCQSHLYAVRIDAESAAGPVIWLTDEDYHIMAPSFLSFLERYMADPRSVLFPDFQKGST